MGLKDELAVTNDPDESAGESLSAEAESPVNADSETPDVQTIDSESDQKESEPDSISDETNSDESDTNSDESAVQVEVEEEEEEEDLEDPQDGMKESCAEKPQCVALQEELTRCNERVEGKSSTTEDCQQELYDFIHCVDHCVAHTLFNNIK